MNEEEIPKVKRTVSLDTRLKMRNARLGNPGHWLGKKRGELSQITKDKIRAKLKGRKLSEEHKKNMAKAKKKMFSERKEILNNYKNNGQSIHPNTEAGNPEQIQ